jgi:hypothetical protein
MGEEVSQASVDMRDSHESHAYAAGMRWSAGAAYEGSMGGLADPAEEEGVYELPPSVADRLAVGEALSAAHRRGRIKRRREDDGANWMMWLVRLVVIQGLLVVVRQMVGLVIRLAEEVSLLSLALWAHRVALFCFAFV